MFLNQRTSQPEASQEEEKVNGDMASVLEEELELDDVQLARVVGGADAGTTTTLGLFGTRFLNVTYRFGGKNPID